MAELLQRRVYARMYRLCADCRFPATVPWPPPPSVVAGRLASNAERVLVGNFWRSAERRSGDQEPGHPRGGSRLQPGGWDVTPDRQAAGRRGQAGSGQRVDRAELPVVGGESVPFQDRQRDERPDYPLGFVK